jgi:hypothetical protein
MKHQDILTVQGKNRQIKFKNERISEKIKTTIGNNCDFMEIGATTMRQCGTKKMKHYAGLCRTCKEFCVNGFGFFCQ